VIHIKGALASNEFLFIKVSLPRSKTTSLTMKRIHDTIRENTNSKYTHKDPKFCKI